MNVETLAKELHEAGRAAVESGQTVAAEKFGDPSRRFLEWDEITEPAREGRRIQARYLLGKFDIAPKAGAVRSPPPPTVGRIVHYLTSEEETYVPQAAIVTSVWKDDVVDLVVFDRANGPKIRQTVPFGCGRGCWQWPPRV